MLAGGAKMEEIGQLLDIGKTTVSRIKTAGFNAEQYKKNTAARKAEEKKPGLLLIPADMDPPTKAEEQCAGQISMEDLQAETQKAEMSDTVKLMRFIAGQMDKRERNAQIYTAEIITHMVKIEDYIAQILRKMDG